MAVTKVPADLFPARGRKITWNIFVSGESICQCARANSAGDSYGGG
jgi:hypothetical protein